MTNLGGFLAARTRKNDIMLGVSGDLSYEYRVVPKYEQQNVGLGFRTKKAAVEFARRTQKGGWRRQVKRWEHDYHSESYSTNQSKEWKKKFRFGYLKGKLARKYANVDGAYGDYAERYKKR